MRRRGFDWIELLRLPRYCWLSMLDLLCARRQGRVQALLRHPRRMRTREGRTGSHLWTSLIIGAGLVSEPFPKPSSWAPAATPLT